MAMAPVANRASTIASLSLIVLGLAGERDAAATFAKVQPPLCSTDQWIFVPYRFIIGGGPPYCWGQGCTGLDVSDNPFQQGTYLPNIHLTRRVFANNYAQEFDYWVPFFQTEWWWDWLPYGRQVSGSPFDWLSGAVGPSWYGVRFDDKSLQSAPGYFIFESDNTIQDTGVFIDGLRVCGRDTPDLSPVNTLYTGRRETGVLLGHGDVVYFALAPSPIVHQTIALWGDAPNDTGADFDLYLRCGLLPTETEWDYRGFSGDTNEFLHTEGLTNGFCQQNWYVAVHSWSGSGMFNIMVNEHYVSQHFPAAYANIEYAADSTELNTWKVKYREGFAEHFGATEGAFYIDTLHLWNNNANPSAAIKFHGVCGRGHSGLPWCRYDGFSNSPIHVYKYDEGSNPTCQPLDLGRILAHELGHYYSGLDDEYDDNGGHCGHTIMDKGYQGQGFNYCRAEDHNSAQMPGAGSAPGGPGWSNSCLLDHTPFRPTETPDNYSFRNFDFNGMFVANIVMH